MEIKRFENYRTSLVENKKNYPVTFNALSGNNYTEDDLIAEGFIGDIVSSLGGGFKDTLINYFVDWGLDKLNMGDGYENGQPTIMRLILQNVAENIDIMDITGYFGKGSCSKWTKLFQDALVEVGVEKFAMGIVQGMGMKLDLSTGIGATVYKTLLNTLSNAVRETEFTQELEKFLSDKICNIQFSDILGGLKGKDRETVASTVQDYTEKNPEKGFKMIDKFNLAGLLG